jgi:hypothetical protein
MQDLWSLQTFIDSSTPHKMKTRCCDALIESILLDKPINAPNRLRNLSCIIHTFFLDTQELYLQYFIRKEVALYQYFNKDYRVM